MKWHSFTAECGLGCHAFAAEFETAGPNWIPPRKHAALCATSYFRGRSRQDHSLEN
jgi:hypothetical protein